jgi:hypothetical protein
MWIKLVKSPKQSERLGWRFNTEFPHKLHQLLR